MSMHANTFYGAGGWSFAPMTPYDWWILWRALENRQDEAKVAKARRDLGALVQTDWLDSMPPVPAEGHDPELLQAMFEAHDKYQDDWIQRQCEFMVSTLERLQAAERPYGYRELERVAGSLVSLAGQMFMVAHDREEEIERGDREP
ncbi:MULTISPECIES: hypothetical protein [Prauserella]|uniref:Uncharacterized protein n=2 Tax=Prauserella TaxID=142577 RepID=A0A318L9Z7_9PSEU|nr:MULTISPECIES: hypothetical protein [Prauserella]PXY17571.1 hypothetical protein BA062_37440 [Prauserella flavalba]PXY18621.1 hypothetical protein BAY59_33635 [Prauserella coralliicola]TKG63551.1 hypothetical protein FCN18_30070 [Prauserella endophytica]